MPPASVAAAQVFFERREKVIGEKRQCRGEQAAGKNLFRKALVDTLEDDDAQTAGIDVGGDSGDTDDCHDRDTNAADDEGHGERQLYLPDAPWRAISHAVGRIEYVAGNGLKAEPDIANEDHQGIGGKAGDGGRGADAEHGNEESKKREARNGEQNAGHDDDDAEGSRPARGPYADDQGDHQSNPD